MQADKLYQERSIKEVENGVFRVRVFKYRDLLTGHPIQSERTVRGGTHRAREVPSEIDSEIHRAVGEPDMTARALLDLWLQDCEPRLDKPGRSGLEQNTYNSYDLQVR